MMGTRAKLKGGDEWDAFHRNSRRILLPYLHKPGIVRWLKRKFWKRQRQEAKTETKP